MIDSQNALEAGSPTQLRILEVVLLLSLFFIYAGDAPPMVNEAHYLAKAKNYWQPDWCSRDLFVTSGKAHTTFYFVFGWLTQFVSLEASAWIGRFVGWSIIAAGLVRLSTALSLGAYASISIAVVWIAAVEQGNLAGEWVIGGIEAKVPAYGLVLFALGEIVDRRWNRAWILLGLASAFHVLTGGWSVIAATFAWFATERHREDRKPLFTRSLFFGGAIAMLGVVPAVWLTLGTDPHEGLFAAKIYTYFRLPHHLLPSGFQFTWYVRHGVLLAMAFAIWLWNRRGVHFPAMQSITAFVFGAMGIAVIGLAIGAIAHLAPDLAAKLLRYYWFRLSDAMVGLWFAVLVAGCLHFPEVSRLWRWIGRTGLLVALVIVVNSSYERMRVGVPPSASSSMLGWDLQATPEEQRRVYRDWVAVCNWARFATKKDELFLTPRHQQTFKWYAERAEVVNFKDVPQDSTSLRQWYNRFQEIYPSRLSGVRVTIHYQTLIEIRRKYGVNFIIVDRRVVGDELPLIRVYPIGEEENKSYAVYELPYKANVAGAR